MGCTQAGCNKKDPKAASQVETEDVVLSLVLDLSCLSLIRKRLHTYPTLVSPHDSELVVLLCFAAQKHHGSKAQSILLMVKKKTHHPKTGRCICSSLPTILMISCTWRWRYIQPQGLPSNPHVFQDKGHPHSGASH